MAAYLWIGLPAADFKDSYLITLILILIGSFLELH